MYVDINVSGKSRVIQLREDTHIPGTTKKRAHIVKTLSNYESVIAEDPDIITKLKTKAIEISKAKNESKVPITF